MKFTKAELKFIAILLGEMNNKNDKDIYRLLKFPCYERLQGNSDKVKKIGSYALYFKISEYLEHEKNED